MILNFQGRHHTLPNINPLSQEIQTFFQSLSIPIDIFTFQANGKILTNFENIPSSTIIRAHIPLIGGKGGYGAKLKTEGGKKVRPNDHMFSRDMSGQRVVYATMERQYTEFVKKKVQEDNRVAKQREQFKIMENTIKEGKSFMKLDKAYKKGVEETEKALQSAIEIGKQKYLQKLKEQQNGKFEEAVKIKKIEKDSQEQKREQERPLKRQAPERQEGLDKIEKKTKTTSQVKVPFESAKPTFSSAQARFQALFKK